MGHIMLLMTQQLLTVLCFTAIKMVLTYIALKTCRRWDIILATFS